MIIIKRKKVMYINNCTLLVAHDDNVQNYVTEEVSLNFIILRFRYSIEHTKNN